MTQERHQVLVKLILLTRVFAKKCCPDRFYLKNDITLETCKCFWLRTLYSRLVTVRLWRCFDKRLFSCYQIHRCIWKIQLRSTTFFCFESTGIEFATTFWVSTKYIVFRRSFCRFSSRFSCWFRVFFTRCFGAIHEIFSVFDDLTNLLWV